MAEHSTSREPPATSPSCSGSRLMAGAWVRTLTEVLAVTVSREVVARHVYTPLCCACR